MVLFKYVKNKKLSLKPKQISYTFANFFYNKFANIFLEKKIFNEDLNTTPITYVFFKHYYNNRPRINTLNKKFFLTFGLLEPYWELSGKNINLTNLKFLSFFLIKYVLYFFSFFFFNYNNLNNYKLIKHIIKKKKQSQIYLLNKLILNYSYKYKKVKRIKKWVKKKLIKI